MDIFNKVGNEAYISLIREMVRTTDYAKNFDKLFSTKFLKLLSNKKNLINLEGSKKIEKKNLQIDLSLESIFLKF